MARASHSATTAAQRQRVVELLRSDPGSAAVRWIAVAFGTLTSMSRLDRITSEPSICHGQPTIRGLRYPVENLLELLASGMTIEEIIEDYPDLDREDLLAALEFGALASGMRRVVPLGAA